MPDLRQNGDTPDPLTYRNIIRNYRWHLTAAWLAGALAAATAAHYTAPRENP